MSDARTQSLLRKCVGHVADQPDLLASALEASSLEQAISLALPEPSNEKCSTTPNVTPTDLHEELIEVCGVLLHRHKKSAFGEASRLVEVPSTWNNIQSLALALTLHSPVLLQGPIGSGKTSLVEHLARCCGRTGPGGLLTIQMGDQTDSKALLGTYVCTDVPGQFRYQPGVLVQAVTEGRWLLIEDIDLAPLDVMSMLIPLLESGRLFVPGRGEVHEAPAVFQLFATRRMDGTGSAQRSEARLLENLWSQVHVVPPTTTELESIIRELFPLLEELVPRLIEAYTSLCEAWSTGFGRGVPLGRVLSARDLFKWCRRVVLLPKISLEGVFFEAIDCFCAPLPGGADRIATASIIGEVLDIAPDTVTYLTSSAKPELKVSPSGAGVTVGRAALPMQESALAVKNIGNTTFANTRHALQLMEQLAVCCQACEPILLVGETGTGKTTAVQHLAALTHHKLTVVNMSQQSDSSELLGGFKPVDIRMLVEPAMDMFERLFFRTFSRKANVSFVETVREAFARKRWLVLLQAFENLIGKVRKRIDAENANSDGPKKTPPEIRTGWLEFSRLSARLKVQVRQAEESFAFHFVEGVLVKALKRGEWILLDEINLATTETLECLNGVLESETGSVLLTERGDSTPIVRHPGFRLFGCMNPANDVGKRDLPPGVRNRFTEIYVPELNDSEDLEIVVYE